MGRIASYSNGFFHIFTGWVVLLISDHAAEAAVLNVGPGEAYTTIQSAVDAADSGDEVKVADGTYTENVQIDRALILRSLNGADTTFIAAANASQHAVQINAENVRV